MSDDPVLWFLARASGLVSLLSLTVAVVLGIAAGARTSFVPRFVTQGLHRAAALTGVLLLLVHVGTVVVDPFVAVRWTDVVVPFRADYQPLWLGLGALAVDTFAVVVVTTLIRHRLGPQWWRWIHRGAYGGFALSMVHGVGAGTDAGEPIVAATTAVAAGVVVASVCMRMWHAAGAGRGRYDARRGPVDVNP
jgi:sulfoxide reductase heme-binding subunit YedZ